MSAALIVLVETLERQRREVIELYIRSQEHNEVQAQHSGLAPVEACGQGEDCESLPHDPGVTGASDRPTPGKSQESVAVAEAAAAVEARSPSEVEGPAPIPSRVFVLRPHCLHPHVCAGYGDKHCHSCLKAVGHVEAAA